MQLKIRKVLYADEGKILTNGTDIFGKIVYLAEDVDESKFYEITDAEYAQIEKDKSDII